MKTLSLRAAEEFSDAACLERAITVVKKVRELLPDDKKEPEKS